LYVEDKPRVDLTLKSKKLKKPLKLDDLKEGMKLKGHIKSVKAKGLTICIRKSKNLQGFCPISELSDDFVSNPSKFYKVRPPTTLQLKPFSFMLF